MSNVVILAHWRRPKPAPAPLPLFNPFTLYLTLFEGMCFTSQLLAKPMGL